MARIIWSWQWPESSGLGNVVDFWLATLSMALPPNFFFGFLTELGNFKQKIFWRQCHWQCCQTKVYSIAKTRWFGPLSMKHTSIKVTVWEPQHFFCPAFFFGEFFSYETMMKFMNGTFVRGVWSTIFMGILRWNIYPIILCFAWEEQRCKFCGSDSIYANTHTIYTFLYCICVQLASSSSWS